MIERLLGSLSKHDFLERYFHKLPHSSPEGCQELAGLGKWEVVEQILSSGGGDVLAVRRGEQSPASHSPSF